MPPVVGADSNFGCLEQQDELSELHKPSAAANEHSDTA
jgi:hypothetical protein